MTVSKWTVFTCFLLQIISSPGGGSVPSFISDEQRLFSNLTTNYQRQIRPVRQASDSLQVKIGLMLLSIEELDVNTASLTAHYWMKQQWKDINLAWNPEEYSNIKRIRIPYSKLWRPDIVLYNNVDDSFYYSAYINAVVSYTGDVTFVPPLRMRSSCSMDMSKYPYDQHTCNIKLGSWTWDGNKINLTSDDDRLLTGMLQENNQWDIIDPKSQINVKRYPCCEEPYPDYTASITLKRKSSYHVYMLFAPSVALALVTPVVFLMPAESGEKSTVGVGVLISQVIMLHMLQDLLPASHFATPALGLHMICNIILMAMCLVISALVNNIWFRSRGVTAMPGTVRMVFLTVLGRALLVTSPEPVFAPYYGYGEDETDKIVPESSVINREWRQLSTVFDRLFFLLYLVVVLIVMFATY